MSLENILTRLKDSSPLNQLQTSSFLSNLDEKTQLQVISAIYIGRDHLHSSRFEEVSQISSNACDHIDPKDFAGIIYEKGMSIPKYIEQFLTCAKASNYNLEQF